MILMMSDAVFATGAKVENARRLIIASNSIARDICRRPKGADPGGPVSLKPDLRNGLRPQILQRLPSRVLSSALEAALLSSSPKPCP